MYRSPFRVAPACSGQMVSPLVGTGATTKFKITYTEKIYNSDYPFMYRETPAKKLSGNSSYIIQTFSVICRAKEKGNGSGGMGFQTCTMQLKFSHLLL